MLLRALLLGTSMLCTVPAFAAIDPPAAGNNDTRIRSLVYDPNNPVKISTVPGASLRLVFGDDETIANIVVSDQDTLAPDPAAPPPVKAEGAAAAQQGSQGAPSCDANLCRSVTGNVVYIKPIRPLDPQPLFIQTSRSNAAGKTVMVNYTFELSTSRPAPATEKDIKTASLNPAAGVSPMPPQAAVWGVRFLYPDRVKEQQQADFKQRQIAWSAQAREKAELAHPVIDLPGADANPRYAYRGSASFQPDRVWDDGRFTYFRYNGNRRVPNIYSQLPNGEPSIPASWPQPDSTGTTLKVSGTEAKWFISDGSDNGKPPVGCLFNLGPDPEGRTSATVATR